MQPVRAAQRQVFPGAKFPRSQVSPGAKFRWRQVSRGGAPPSRIHRTAPETLTVASPRPERPAMRMAHVPLTVVWKAGVGIGVVTKRVAKHASGEDRSGGGCPDKAAGGACNVARVAVAGGRCVVAVTVFAED
jgi:hypothetical protein